MFSILYFTNYRFYPVKIVHTSIIAIAAIRFGGNLSLVIPFQNMPALFRNLDTILTAGLMLRNVRLINVDVATVPCLHLMLLYFDKSTEDRSRPKKTLALAYLHTLTSYAISLTSTSEPYHRRRKIQENIFSR